MHTKTVAPANFYVLPASMQLELIPYYFGCNHAELVIYVRAFYHEHFLVPEVAMLQTLFSGTHRGSRISLSIR